MFSSPGSIALQFGNVVIHWYGVMLAVAFFFGVYFIQKFCDFYKDDKSFFINEDILPQERVLDLSIVLLFSAILGARLYYVIFDWKYFSQNLLEIHKIWNGGLSIHGAILGGFIGGIYYCHRNKLNWRRYADVVAPGLALGQAIGRWGNFFNSEAFGLPTNLPWKLYIPLSSRPVGYENFQYFHPAFLYESLFDLAVFFILILFLRKKLFNYKGGVFFAYLILYSLGRFFIEGLRVDSINFIFGLPLAQIISILLLIVGSLSLIYVVYFNKKLDN